MEVERREAADRAWLLLSLEIGDLWVSPFQWVHKGLIHTRVRLLKKKALFILRAVCAGLPLSDLKLETGKQ